MAKDSTRVAEGGAGFENFISLGLNGLFEVSGLTNWFYV